MPSKPEPCNLLPRNSGWTTSRHFGHSDRQTSVCHRKVSKKFRRCGSERLKLPLSSSSRRYPKKLATAHQDEIKKRQLNDWNLAAPGWKKWEKRFLQNLQPLTEVLINSAGIKPGDSVLDLATGTGEPALKIAKTIGPKGKVVGVDLSPGMLSVAKERAAAQGIHNVTFQLNDHDDMPALEDNSFDAAVCRFGLMFMPDPARILGAIRRVLKPHGKASVATWSPPEKVPFFSIVSKIVTGHFPDVKPMPPGVPGGVFGIPSQEMLGGFFEKAGLKGFSSQLVQLTFFKDASPEEYWEAMSEMGGPLVALLAKTSPDKRKIIGDDVIRKLRDMFPNGSVKLGGEAIVGAGSKG